MDSHELVRFRLLLTAILGAIVVGGVVDLILDQPTDWLSVHVLFEVGMVTLALVTATALVLGWQRAEEDASVLRHSLEERRAERDAWRASARKALEGLGEAIHDQFLEWQLTPAEREVALLLLKGYSHKAVARRTDRSPETARQHASAVYRKSGLSGRAELAAFFLEDLMLPGEGEEEDGVRGSPDEGPGPAGDDPLEDETVTP